MTFFKKVATILNKQKSFCPFLKIFKWGTCTLVDQGAKKLQEDKDEGKKSVALHGMLLNLLSLRLYFTK